MHALVPELQILPRCSWFVPLNLFLRVDETDGVVFALS